MANAVDPLGFRVLFEDLQKRIDNDTEVRDQIRDIVQTLEKEVKVAYSILTNAYSRTAGAITNQVHEKILIPVVGQIDILSDVMAGQPYYKFNGQWQQQMQDASLTILLFSWLGGYGMEFEGRLLSLEEVGEKMKIPVNLKHGDALHLTIEEYLQSVISLMEELGRIARNSVILGNYKRPLVISEFMKDLHAGFQLLNLRNSNLRKRSDSVKYRIREVEDIVYDLSLRNLLPKD